MRTTFFVIALPLGIAACASLPANEDAQSIEQIAAQFSGRELRLSQPDADTAVTDANSAARDPVYGYVGVQQAFAPAQRQCEARGGTLQANESRTFFKATAALPTRLQCRAADKPLWTLGVHYAVRTGADAQQRPTLFVTPHASLANEVEIEQRVTQRDASPKLEPRAKPKERSAQKTASAPTPKAPGAVTLKNFRKSLKPGDRVQWKNGDQTGKSVGTIVRLNGDLALIQFDNLASAGQSVRYVNRAQLAPFDGIASVRLSR